MLPGIQITKEREIHRFKQQLFHSFKYIYDSFSDVGEIRVYWRADFQSGSRVLKKVF